MFEKFDWMIGRYQELSEAIGQPEIIAPQLDEIAAIRAAAKHRFGRNAGRVHRIWHLHLVRTAAQKFQCRKSQHRH